MLLVMRMRIMNSETGTLISTHIALIIDDAAIGILVSTKGFMFVLPRHSFGID